jgi:hypothetical protein
MRSGIMGEWFRSFYRYIGKQRRVLARKPFSHTSFIRFVNFDEFGPSIPLDIVFIFQCSQYVLNALLLSNIPSNVVSEKCRVWFSRALAVAPKSTTQVTG